MSDEEKLETGAPRYRHARELAGLSLGQANRLLGFDLARLSAIELGDELPTEGAQRRMCEVYGCSLEWLRGDHVEPRADLVKALRDKGVSDHDRDAVLEFAAMIQGRPPVKPAAEQFAAMRERTEPQIPVREKADYVRSQGQTRSHHCHWPGCKQQVPPAMWGCKAHWFKLPRALRDRIWRAYSPGQEVDMTPSAEYLQVADDVQRWIRENGETR